MRCLVPVSVLFACGVGLAQPASRNMLSNSGFELGRPGGKYVKHWQPSTAPGVTCERRFDEPYDGQACAVVAVGPEAQVSWHQMYQSARNVGVGQTLALSAWARTRDARDGVGAYISLNFFDGDERRVDYRDSESKLVGTTQWTRLVVTAQVPERTAEARAILLLHGHGEAYFDDVQLEVGSEATDYEPSRPDLVAAVAQTRALAEAERYRAESGFQRSVGRDLAVLDDDFPRLGAPSDPKVLTRALEAAGFRCHRLTGAQLANPALLTPDSFDVLVLPYGPAVPAAARETIQDYLAGGGCLLTMGGYAFDVQMARGPQGWVPLADLPRQVGEKATRLFTPEELAPEKWSSGGGPRGAAPVLTLDEQAAREGVARLQFAVREMRGWATARTPAIPADRFFQGWSELVFRARGDEHTPRMLVEWHEQDGARWKAAVDLTTEWKEYVLVPSDFAYWRDNPSVGRGGPGDQPNLSNMAAIMVGLSTEVVADGGDYTFWIEDPRIADDPYESLRQSPEVMNTRHCRIRDAMWPKEEQIGVFDPSHPLKDAARARAAEGQSVVPASLKLDGPFEGMAAVGVLSVQGHGFGPDRSRIVPLVQSYDRYGRPRGALGSVMYHFDGYFAKSAWGFFGVSNRDLFAEGDGTLLPHLPGIVQRLVDRTFLYGTETEYACYRAGEQVTIRTRVANHGPRAQRGTAVLSVSPAAPATAGDGKTAQRREFRVDLEPGAQDVLEMTWTAPAEGADLFIVRSELRLEGKTAGAEPYDQEENGFVVWRDSVARSGPSVAIRDSYFDYEGRPRYLIGCQNWWGTNGSISQRRVTDWERDFQMMQDLGMRISRCFLPWQTEEQKRASDAWVYLAQKHRIVMFHTPNFMATADPEQLADHTTRAKEIAARYRDVPGFIMDTCNETGVTSDDTEKERAVFNQWLRDRHGTDERLREAWGEDAPEQALPQVPFSFPPQRWDSLRARDVTTFAVDRLADWARVTREAFRSVRPDLAVTPGWGQGFGWGPRIFDPPLASRDQDFTDQHYYGELADFGLYLKTLDRRWAGQPLSVGECGARQHPSFPGGETEEEYSRRFLYLHHHAFGLGSSFTATWHWRDPMAGIFPFGKVYSDHVLREAALVERNQALMFGPLRPVYEPAEVYLLLPDAHRLTGGKETCVRAICAAAATLMGLDVPFESLCEADLDRIPTACKALVWPVPYCPTDETFERVLAFVRGGGSLLVTGDVGYADDLQWTKADRVKLLTGATEVTRRYPWLEMQQGEQSRVSFSGVLAGRAAPAAAVGGYEGRPSLALSVTGEEVVARSDEGAVAVLRRLDAGQVLFVGEPIELERDVPRRGIYAAFLELAGVKRLAVTPDRENLHVFRVPLEDDGQAIVAYNAGEPCRAVVGTRHGPLAMELKGMGPGMAVLDAQGRPVLAEAQGETRLGDQPVARSRGHATVLALDGKPLASSGLLAVLPFEAGDVTVAREGTGEVVAEAGELAGGQWRRLAEVRATAGPQGLRIECPAEVRLQVVLVAEAGRMDEARRRLVVLLAE